MTINKIKNGEKLTLAIEGRVDTMTSPELEETVKDSVGDITNLVIDLKDVDYISSAGLRVLLGAHKIMVKKGGMKIVNAGDSIMEIFEVTGFSDILDIG